jgi:hypothetical protein
MYIVKKYTLREKKKKGSKYKVEEVYYIKFLTVDLAKEYIKEEEKSYPRENYHGNKSYLVDTEIYKKINK